MVFPHLPNWIDEEMTRGTREMIKGVLGVVCLHHNMMISIYTFPTGDHASNISLSRMSKE